MTSDAVLSSINFRKVIRKKTDSPKVKAKKMKALSQELLAIYELKKKKKLKQEKPCRKLN